MTRPANSPRVPGTTLLKIADRLFSEHFVAAVIQPTIADLQSELAVAGVSRIKRLRAHWRGRRSSGSSSPGPSAEVSSRGVRAIRNRACQRI
jgi:hypothetical protein